jgi:hypothetical protein
LRAYGNAITIGVAVEFIKAAMEVFSEGRLQEQEDIRKTDG